MATKSVPDGYHTVTPYLIIAGAAKAIDFYKQAFDAKELIRLSGPNESIGHAEIQIGNSRIMLADEFPDMGFRSPQTLGGAGMSLMVYVENAETLFQRALSAGAVELRPFKKQFYGDCSGTLRDPFGHLWTLAIHVEDVSPDEVHRRAEEFLKQSSEG